MQKFALEEPAFVVHEYDGSVRSARLPNSLLKTTRQLKSSIVHPSSFGRISDQEQSDHLKQCPEIGANQNPNHCGDKPLLTLSRTPETTLPSCLAEELQCFQCFTTNSNFVLCPSASFASLSNSVSKPSFTENRGRSSHHVDCRVRIPPCDPIQESLHEATITQDSTEH